MLIDNKKYTYRLQKIKDLNNESLVYIGHSSEGLCTLIQSNHGVHVKVTGLDWLITSPIVGWHKKGNKYTINTRNSIYELAEIPNGKKNSKKSSKSSK